MRLILWEMLNGNGAPALFNHSLAVFPPKGTNRETNTRFDELPKTPDP